MFRFRKKLPGFTIVEVVVSALIFSIAAAGIIAMVSNLRPAATISVDEVGASLCAKQIMERLRSAVDARTYDTGNLSLGSYSETCGKYTVDWDIYDEPGVGRQIKMNVDWAD